ncbi:hypothetical protein PsorP6_004188 [Peronosclerospora sorghi]|uniref:Uncharacterized protein n=1 Tax=Peronosclerospora sorghi TaxID=230839 RepID=A0ACC0VNU6_9STRA|nr:hypothetical protein PsorP6_004188 [Peronosclerospora sorghi]
MIGAVGVRCLQLFAQQVSSVDAAHVEVASFSGVEFPAVGQPYRDSKSAAVTPHTPSYVKKKVYRQLIRRL